MKTQEFTLHTDREGMYNVTTQVRTAVRESGVQSGMAIVYCPHTTAGITINENADPTCSTTCCSASPRPSPTGASSATRRATRPPTSSPAVLARASAC